MLIVLTSSVSDWSHIKSPEQNSKPPRFRVTYSRIARFLNQKVTAALDVFLGNCYILQFSTQICQRMSISIRPVHDDFHHQTRHDSAAVWVRSDMASFSSIDCAWVRQLSLDSSESQNNVLARFLGFHIDFSGIGGLLSQHEVINGVELT